MFSFISQFSNDVCVRPIATQMQIAEAVGYGAVKLMAGDIGLDCGRRHSNKKNRVILKTWPAKVVSALKNFDLISVSVSFSHTSELDLQAGINFTICQIEP